MARQFGWNSSEGVRRASRALADVELLRRTRLDTAILMHQVQAVEGAAAYVQNDFAYANESIGGDSSALIAMTTEDFALQLP